MKTVSICSSFYESGRRYLDDCMNSIIAAISATDCRVHMIVAIDNLENPEQTLAPYAQSLEITLVPTPAGTSISGVRNRLFEKARLDTSVFLIFLDMDDVLAPEGIRLHLECLERADISYGDMELIDCEGQPLPGSLYANASIPEQVSSVDALLQRNFFGLSNTAIRRAVLDKLPGMVPEHLIATDWWFYTALINAGCTACKTSAPVGSYRQHGFNILGSNPAADISNLAKRCKIVRDHYAALPHIERIEALDQSVERVERAIKNDPIGLTRIIEETRKMPGAWFEEIFQIANRLQCEP